MIGASRCANPVGYIDATLRAILDSHLQSGIEDLTPWRYKQTSTLAV
jgi:transposase